MAPKEKGSRQFGLQLDTVSLDVPKKPRTEEDLPGISPHAPWQVIRDYHEQAKAFGVSVLILKYAEDTYGSDYELFIEMYKNTGSIDQSDALMAKNEGAIGEN